MEGNGVECKVTSSDYGSHPREAEIMIPTGLAAWISFEAVLPSEN